MNNQNEEICNKNKESVSVIFATNQTYLPYLGVALFSLIEHTSRKYNYNIYIFYTQLNKTGMARIASMTKENIHIEFCDISLHAKRITAYADNYLTEESTYRLLIPEILPKLKRALYLDCDIVVLKDVADLYHQDLQGRTFGVIKDCYTVWGTDYCTNYLHINYLKYFNAGILVIDIQKMRKENVSEKCFQILNSGKTYHCLDQDALNITCSEAVTYLDARWNCLWSTVLGGALTEYEAFCKEVAEEAYIIHYASDKKPWNLPQLQLADVFWHYARQTIFYEEILFTSLSKKEELCAFYFKKADFPFNKILPGSEIVLYGAGGIGETFFKQLQITEYCKVILWLDKNYDSIEHNKGNIFPPVCIKSKEFDFVVIAVESEIMALEIKGELIALDVPKEKIIWQSPLKRSLNYVEQNNGVLEANR